MSTGTTLRAQIDLPTGVATWVLCAHVATLATPFVLMAVIWRRRDAVIGLTDRPVLLLIGAGLVLAGSVFEAAQNTEERWYYVGPHPALSDAAFTFLITAGLGAFAIAGAGGAWWPWVATLIGCALVVVLYRRGLPGFPGLGVAGVAAAVALYDALDQPVVALLLVATGFLNAYFLDGVVRTRAQSLHGAIALSNGLGLLVVAYALDAAATGRRLGWVSVLVMAGLTVGAALLAWPAMRRLAPTPRPSAAASPAPEAVPAS